MVETFMLLAVRELQNRPVVFDHDYAAGAIVCDHPALQLCGPLHVHLNARLSGPQIRVHFEMHGDLQPICARCLEPVNTPIACSVELVYHPAADLAPREDVEIGSRDTDVAFFEGEGVEIEDIVREQVLLALPERVICRDDCRGLCPHCGQNLNVRQCACVYPSDPRWSALADLREPGKGEHKS
jgi:uncharacterized protein